MDELIFILILAGIGVLLMVAMFTYYKHQKKINDEIENFNHHGNTIDDVLLNDNRSSSASSSDDIVSDSELPGSFTASRQDNFDIEQVNITHDNNYHIKQQSDSNVSQTKADDRELVDGVFIKSKRVIKTSSDTLSNKNTLSSFKKTTERFASFAGQNKEQTQAPEAITDLSDSVQDSTQKIKVVYDPVPDGVKELIISHTILTKGEFFSGPQLYKVLKNAGLSYGGMNIFHYPCDDKAETFALFSIANLIEPGTFDLLDGEIKTPGILIFMRLPARVECYEAYDKFIHVAQKIAADLGGKLCDETRTQVTQQVISYKKEQIKKLKFEMEKAKKLPDMDTNA
ncbi:MAG: cell division protein ZipA C-terminal FtsZ-binding domain-containing protein [Thiohalomonas sp.]|nr:cell division protein ZipA C-terminal FtsZ-binding domain-containing protein [Thiohalomonas sp.]